LGIFGFELFLWMMSQLGCVYSYLDDVIGPWAPKSRGKFVSFQKTR